MAGVMLYALPNAATEAFPVLKEATSFIKPYMLLTSQWQRWNLFAPDPLRRVTTFHIDAQSGEGHWQEVAATTGDSVAWWHRATELKTIRRLEKEANRHLLRERYVHDACVRLALLPGTPMRLRIRYTVIPKINEWKSPAWWNAWEPTFREETDLSTLCPTLS